MLNPSLIRLGPGRVYIGVTAPATGVPLALVTGAPATGTDVGLTEGETLFTFDVEYDEEVADQVLPIVAVFAKGESATLEFTMKQYAATQLQAVMQQGALVTDDGTTPKTDMIKFGGTAYEVRNYPVLGPHYSDLVNPERNFTSRSVGMHADASGQTRQQLMAAAAATMPTASAILE